MFAASHRARSPRTRGARVRWFAMALAALTGLGLVTLPALAKSKPKTTAATTAASKTSTTKVRTGLESLEQQVRTFTLPNGLRFILVERHQAPVFSFITVVDAGSSNDQIGTTGLAHMMEHMAFKGTPLIGTSDYAKEKTLLANEEHAWDAVLDERRKGARADTTKLKKLQGAFEKAENASHEVVVGNEFSKWIEQSGGQNVNAYTADDITAYFYSMPSNRLEMWALLEGSRMTYPVFREFYKERDVVYEERRMRYESSPFGRLLLEFVNAAFTAHPYGQGGIGFPSDLKTFTREQGEEYFRKHYVAKNMVVGVVGDVTMSDLQKYAKMYFSDLSDAPKPPPVDTVEPEQHAERRVVMQDPGQPLVFVGWHIPAATDPTYPAYEAVSDLLAGGDYARLNKALVKEKKICTQVQMFTGFPGEKYPNLMVIFAVPAAGQDPAKVEKEIYATLDEVQTTKPFTADEVAGYKVRIKAQKIEAVESNDNLASELAQAETLYGDWHEFFRDQERVQSLRPSDLLEAMKRTMTRNNRTVGMLVNSPQATNEGGPK